MADRAAIKGSGVATEGGTEMQEREPSGWAIGWITFAAFMMIIIGSFHVIAGLVALGDDNFYVVGKEYIFQFDTTTWGWIHLLLGGGTVTTWITLPSSAFQWLAGQPAQYASSAHSILYFCPNCGAQLAFISQLSPETIDVTIATLDHPELAVPERHIWTASRLPWLHLDEQLPGEAGETL